MRKAAVYAVVGASYTLLVGILLVIVLALTTAVADGWRLRAAAAAVVERSPSFSPDGTQIAFIRDGDGAPQLWVMGVDGTDQRPLAKAHRFSWSGRALVFERAGRVFRVDPDGGLAVPVHARLGRASTRSGERRVFVRSNHVYLRDSDGAVWELT
jgi:dipeptidyl aminopeptidase/acylaminoacyl peptidase